ncbi:hypothetical protein [Sulfitobacter dubius]|uniref:Uncharacterized protein n=1 Tax=Sulfitobacter dubius TaxID=218673 RepID=A0ABY3ZQ22_9RHOB|nr:hypothetical protein [Sulfitobacter dubius]UOA15869.1 hypothetical protein DSM109990_02715 [Sulfitobacter dubius]
MRDFILKWLMFLPILAVAVIPAWFGLHFRGFLQYIGWIGLFSVLAVVWLRLTRRKPGQDDE